LHDIEGENVMKIEGFEGNQNYGGENLIAIDQWEGRF